MTNNRNRKKRRHGYHHQNAPLENRIRVRAKRLEELDQAKLTLAVFLLSQRLAEDRTEPTSVDSSGDEGGESPDSEIAA